MEIQEIVKKLIGKIEPYGDSNIDNERFYNICNHITLVNYLIEDLINAAKYKDRPEYSISKIGGIAYNELLDLKEIIDNEIKD